MTKVTAIIPSLYTVDAKYLKLCVESLRATVDWDIIVVTNGTKTPEPIESYAGEDIKGISNRLHSPIPGQCTAVNIGASVVNPTTEYLFIVNSDMYFAPGWNKKLNFDYSVFSPNLLEPIDNNGSADPFLKIDGGFTIENFARTNVDNFVAEHNDAVIEHGFNFPLFIRKDLWEFLGGYDTNYDPWGSNSDTDLQTRINLAGVTPKRLRDVLVYHFSNKSGTFDGTHQEEYQHNIDYFKDKFGFDRDELGSDVWYNKDMLPDDESKIRYEQQPFEVVPL